MPTPRVAGIRVALVVPLAVCSAALPAPAQSVTAPPVPDLGEATRSTLAWQIALESWAFSPGLLDGVIGPKTRTAIAAAQATLGRSPTGNPDPETASALGVDKQKVLTTYRITSSDTAQIDDELPIDWNEKARKSRLTYSSILDLVAERFHTTESLLRRINPGVALLRLRAGDRLNVPATRAFRNRRGVDPTHVEIDLDRKLILVIQEDAKKQRYLVGILHCSVAADRADALTGEFRVAKNVENPEYTFDPRKWPEVQNVTKVLTIPAGPRNPVGVRWIGLDREGYGIHGTPHPRQIGKTGSHGCFRLTNWDAVWLSEVIGPSKLRVRIYDNSGETSWVWGA